MEEIKGITNTVVSCNKTFQYSSRRKKKKKQSKPGSLMSNGGKLSFLTLCSQQEGKMRN